MSSGQPQKSPDRPRLPRAVWLLSWVSFFADVSGEMIYPLLPLFLVGVLGASKTQLGMIEGTAIFLVAIMTAYAGFHSDRSGRRVPWVRVGYALPVLGKAVIALATAWPLVLGGRLLDRFGKGLRASPRDALIADAVDEYQRGRAFGVHRALDTAGALVGVLLSALLLWWLTGTPHRMDGAETGAVAQTPAWVYRAIFGVASVLGLAALVLTFFIREADAKDPQPPPDPQSSPTKEEPESGPLGLPRAYWSALAVMVLFSLGNSSDTFLLLRASDLGFSPWTVVMMYATFNATYAALSYGAGALSDRIGRWRIIALGWAIYAVVYIGFALMSSSESWAVWPLMAFYGVYMALTDGVGKALIADRAPSAKRGTAMGIFYALTGLTTLGASLLAGMVWDRAGPKAAFLIGAGFAVMALISLPFLIRTSSSSSSTASRRA
ncbi:MAG: MFS transporter [Planctomycetota bacterium]|nr:MFS transporter [Planctomycetota bacterium]